MNQRFMYCTKQMVDLVKTFLLQFMKGEAVEVVQSYKLSTLDLARHSQLPDGDLVIGEPTRRELKKLKEDKQKGRVVRNPFFLHDSNYLSGKQATL